MSARPARSAQSVLRESVASMSSMQLAVAAREIGVSRSTLVAFGEARSSLPDHCLQRLATHIFAGRYFVKS
jgi:hypothetical protein